MSFVLVYSEYDHRPQIGESVNINRDDEYGRALYQKVNRHFPTVFADASEAGCEMPDPKHVIYTVPFLADGVKNTSKMNTIHKKMVANGDKSATLRAKWKERALSVKTKSCYHCGSKINQDHAAVNSGRVYHGQCPSCNADDYLLTQSDRNKIIMLREKNQTLRDEFKALEKEQIQKLVKKNAKIHYLVGGWVHECDVESDEYYDDDY